MRHAACRTWRCLGFDSCNKAGTYASARRRFERGVSTTTRNERASCAFRAPTWVIGPWCHPHTLPHTLPYTLGLGGEPKHTSGIDLPVSAVFESLPLAHMDLLNGV